MITEADILSQVIDPDKSDLPPEVAQSFLAMRFNDSAVDRMNALSEKNRQGKLSQAEQEEPEKYLRVGQFLNLLQAKARLSLKKTTS